MHFTSKQDINAPIDYVFQHLTNFELYEAHGMRVGATIERLDTFTQIQPGMCWHISGYYRGKKRNVELTLDTYEPVETLKYTCVSKPVDALIELHLTPLSRSETRIKIDIAVKAKQLSARVILQSARIAKNTLDRKFDTRMRNLANKLSEKYYTEL